MLVFRVSPLALGLLVLSTAAHSYEGKSQRQEIDGGVHVPQLTRAPTLQNFVQAEYPPEAKAAGIMSPGERY